MELIKWEEKYSVGVEEVDRQHQRLFALLNRFIENFGGPDKAGLADVLEEMVNYIDFHFKCEEGYLQAHPDIEEHRREHFSFVRKTLQLQKDYLQDKADITLDVLQFLVSWLKNHILGMDRKFFEEMGKIAS